MLRSIYTSLLNLIYPELCCNCGTTGSYICKSCILELDILLFPLQLSADSSLSSITVPFSFTPPISNLITTMKYNSVVGVASCIAELLYLHTNYPQTDVITFIPMSTAKQRVRGFNQTEQIAQRFAALAQTPCVKLLKKTSTHLTSQAKQSTLQERKQHLHSQELRYCYQHPPPRSVLLIDDVYTTGQTMASCAKVLLSHGVKEVHGLALCHGS